ncbi:hypothetical protein BGZ60DRAFT_434742 [Tricladium varicosporioides]|nr:hypothetical protein BGZ60DRAFT_434742 [Hymenoscyphus varicosporioides]
MSLSKAEEPATHSSSIIIAAPPNVVREMFLDFTQIPKYSPNGFIKSLQPLPAGKTGHELKEGDLMKNSLGGITVHPTVLVNNDQEFRWRGPWPYKYFNLLTGYHIFKFLPAENGGTMFVHEENFEGVLAWLMRLDSVTKKTVAKFEYFNLDLRTWIEGKDGKKIV